MNKKIISLLLAVIMVFCLCACGNTSNGDSTEPDDPSGDGEVLEEITLPLCDEKQELTVWLLWSNEMVADPNELEGIQYLDELTNVHINWITISSTELTEKLQLLQASDNLPDIIVPNYYSANDEGINDGWLMDMSPLIAQYMPNYREFLATHEKEARLLKSDDGVVRCFANVAGNDSEIMGEQQWCGLCVRSDLIEKAGYTGKLETIEDYHNMLLTCKQKLENLDAPLYVSPSGAGITGAFMSAYGVTNSVYNDNGTVRFGPAEEGYGQWLAEMRKWYSEGLIDPNFDTVSGLDFYMAPASVVGTNRSVCFTALYNEIGTLMPMVLQVTTDPTTVITPVVNHVLHEGDEPAMSGIGTGSGGIAVTGCVYISADCKNPALAAKWLDFTLTEQAMVAVHYGREGVQYTLDDSPDAPFRYVLNEGYKTSDEVKAKLGTSGIGRYNWDVGAQSSAASMEQISAIYAAQGIILPDSYQDQVDAKAMWDAQRYIDPMQFVTLTDAESTSIATISTDITTRVSEYTVQYIKGQTDESFEDFVQELENMQLQTVIDVHMVLHNTKPGQVIRLKHGETLDLSRKFSTANCDGGRKEFQEITYICRGAEVEEYTPHFSVFGFRYALVKGIEDPELEAIAIYSDCNHAGTFQCSNPLINKLVENARWSQKGNFLDVPVDCPTRERNTWTGDAMIYCRTAAWLMDVQSFFKKWLKDQAIEQYASGKVGITFPSTSSIHDPEELKILSESGNHGFLAGPEGEGHIGEDSVGWGDSAVWIPYQMYLMYGDKEFLVNQYDTAKHWVEFSLRCMKEKNPLYADRPWYKNGDGDKIYDTRFHYGEWNEPLPPAPEVMEFFKSGKGPAEYVAWMAQYGKPEVATAYTKRSCDNLAHMAEILGKQDDAAHYKEISQEIKTAYNKYMIGPDGTIQPGHQAAYVRALALDLVSEEKRPLVISQLKKEIEAADYHLNTGFLSTVYLLPTLCDNGLKEEAFRILEQTTAPGWLHPITMGATTMLENWDGMDVFRDSFNHYSFGAVCQFLFEYVAGIRPTYDGPGFQSFELKPVIGGSLTNAEGTYPTKYGEIKSAWYRENDTYSYSCTIPAGTTALLTLPDGRIQRLSAGSYKFQGKLP